MRDTRGSSGGWGCRLRAERPYLPHPSPGTLTLRRLVLAASVSWPTNRTIHAGRGLAVAEAAPAPVLALLCPDARP